MTIVKILGHPLTQLVSFCIILVGSAYFGGPFIWFLFHAVQEAYMYAIIGWMGVAVVLCGLFMHGRGAAVMQFIGVILMALSLIVFFISSENFMNMYGYRQVVPLLTLGLFVAVVVVVVRKFLN